MTAAPAVLPGICTRGPTITIATTSNPTTTLYLNLPDSGPLAFDLATTTAGTMLDPAIVRWKVTGAGATPGTGTNAGTVSVDGSTAGNWTYTVTAWIDQNNNNQIDAGESQLQATVRVIKPILTVTDEVSGNQITDDTNSSNSPDTPLAVVTDGGSTSWLNMSLTDELSGTPLPNVFTYVLDTSYLARLASGQLSTSTSTSVGSPTTSGECLLSVYSNIDPNFKRFVQIYALKLNIVWSGPTMTGVANATEVLSGEVLQSDDEITLLAGQHLVLGYTTGTFSGVAVQSVQWNLNDSANNFIKGFATDPSSATSPTWGSVTLLSASDLTGGTLTAFGVTDLPSHEIDLNLTAMAAGKWPLTFSTKTIINFEKPGESIWAGKMSFEAKVSPGEISGTGAPSTYLFTGAYVTWNATLPLGPSDGYVGSLTWVQLANGWNKATKGGGLYGDQHNTGGHPELDNTYPYGSGNTGSDEPGIRYQYGTYYESIWENKLWMMWTPPGLASIPVPIQTKQYPVDSNATWNSTTNWFNLSFLPEVTYYGAGTNDYPTWSGVYINHDDD